DEELPRLVLIAGTLQPTPRWALSLADLRAEIQNARHRANMQTLAAIAERGRAIARTNAEIADTRLATWREQQASQDRVHRATIESILEVHDWRGRDGSAIAVPHTYDHVFQDGLGNLILSDDPNYDPTADTSLRTR